jgi:hypothetical protein
MNGSAITLVLPATSTLQIPYAFGFVGGRKCNLRHMAMVHSGHPRVEAVEHELDHRVFAGQVHKILAAAIFTPDVFGEKRTKKRLVSRIDGAKVPVLQDFNVFRVGQLLQAIRHRSSPSFKNPNSLVHTSCTLILTTQFRGQQAHSPAYDFRQSSRFWQVKRR